MVVIGFNAAEERLMAVRGQRVIPYSDAAALYGVRTREVDQAVPEKFPRGYITGLGKGKWASLKSKFLISGRVGKNKLSEGPERPKQKELTERSGEIIACILDKGMHKTVAETGMKINFALYEVQTYSQTHGRRQTLIYKS
ncbi:MAG: ORF6N domain-containing protein [Rikenellaceae bacterium]|nr:ORF6N domain-containing protein [Rikenellaceae bacterium]